MNSHGTKPFNNERREARRVSVARNWSNVASASPEEGVGTDRTAGYNILQEKRSGYKRRDAVIREETRL